MGCNCGKAKNRTAPVASTPAPAPKRPAPQPVSRSTGQTQSFTLRVGYFTQTFGSRLEAEAANVRHGGGGVIGSA